MKILLLLKDRLIFATFEVGFTQTTYSTHNNNIHSESSTESLCLASLVCDAGVTRACMFLGHASTLLVP